ncbi:MAG: Grx4 family monothiol glutaredoxin [Candidatus Eutrophobiaceae bacterium]
MSTENQIKSTIKDNSIVLFMKGTPDAPKCGFSMQTVQALRSCTDKFAYVDVLANPDVRATLPAVSKWPTFPQLFINGELIGGCDIVLEMFQKGELQDKVEQVVS